MVPVILVVCSPAILVRAAVIMRSAINASFMTTEALKESSASAAAMPSHTTPLPRSRIGAWFGLPYGPLTTRAHLERLVRDAAEALPAGSIVLDAGAGDSPYRRFFSHCTYEATDICERDVKQYAHINYICDLTAIPVAPSRYDFVLCTQVLEHVPDPRAVMVELSRVLKPGGRIWLSTPLSFQEHEVPFDFYRYTQFGLRHLFEDAGLEIERIDWVQGYCGTVAHQMNLARHMMPRKPADFGGGFGGVLTAGMMLLAKPMLGAIAVVLARADMRSRYTAQGHCLDYYVVARKPSS